jgi:hypothetical protein
VPLSVDNGTISVGSGGHLTVRREFRRIGAARHQ